MKTNRSNFLATLGLTAAGRGLGYARDVLLAYAFGTSVLAELFIYGFRLQLVGRTILADQPIPSVLVPRLLAVTDRAALAARAWRTTVIIGLFVTLTIILAQPLLVRIIAPGLTNSLTVAALVGAGAGVSLWLSALSSIRIAQLQAGEQFAAASAVPLLFNGVLIIAVAASIIVADNPVSVAVLFAIGFLLAGGAQLWFANRLARQPEQALQPSKGKGWLSPDITNDFLSVASLKALEPLPLLIVASFASAAPGYFAGLYFAERLAMLGPSVLGLAAGSLLLTDLSKSILAEAPARARAQFWRAVAIVGGLALLGSIVLELLTQPLIALLLARGAFDAAAIQLVTSFLKPLIWFIPFAAIDYVTLQVFVAKRSLRPMLALGGVSLLLTALMAARAESAAEYAWALALPGIMRVTASLALSRHLLR